jgi:excisionase family DNA binding protein
VNSERMLSPAELAEELRVPLKTLYAWRTKGEGPVGYRIGRHIRFKREDVDRWLATRAEDSPGSARSRFR